MTESKPLGVGDVTPPYMIFVVVFLFFLTGLIGFLICHLLKKKGYRCRTGDLDDGGEEADKLGGDADEDDDNQDTVEQILKCIIENEENMEAFNEMLGSRSVCARHDPRLRKDSIGGLPAHHHTVHSGTDHNSCLLCAQVRSKKGRRQSRTPRSKQRPGEQTVFSVGRFRVTHHDKKRHGGSSTLVSSGEHLDQPQDRGEPKEGGYNLRSMFKDAPLPPESAAGAALNVAKRRRSLPFFGLRRGSDPAGVKVGEPLGKEVGGFRVAIKQQLVTVEEQAQTENTKPPPESAGPPAIEPETKRAKASVNSPSSQPKIQDQDSIPSNDDGSKNRPDPELRTNPMKNPSIGRSEASASTSFSTPASSGEVFKMIQRTGDAEDRFVSDEEWVRDSEPFTSAIGTDQPEPVTQTPPEPSSSPDLQPGVGKHLPSSIFFLTSPTTPPSGVSNPECSRDMSSEAAKAALTFTGSANPALPGSQRETIPVSLQTPSGCPADPGLSTGSPLPVTSALFKGKGDRDLSSSSVKEQGGATILKREENENLKRPGIFQTANVSLVESGSKMSSSSTIQPSEGGLNNLPLSHSSPTGSRVTNATIMKASPDNRREFVVVTLEEEQKPEVGSEHLGISPADGQETNLSDFCVERRASVAEEKDDMEMEDIKCCKGMQVEEMG